MEMGQTILEAALAAEIPYPHGCRSGNCGACKSELVSGEVEMSPYSSYALTEAEKEQGYILACRSVPWSDCEVAWVEAADTEVHPIRRLVCRVRALEDATHDIRIMRLEVLSGGPFSFAAGQFARVSFDGLPSRDYSMANRPDEPLLEFHVRLIPGGAVTPYVAKTLAVGDEVRLDAPLGTSYLRRHHRGPIVAMGGGSGLAPVKSIVESALEKGMRQPIHLYLGVRAERDVYMEDHFHRLAAAHPNLRVHYVLSEALGETARRTGYLHEALAADFESLDGCMIYLAGPPVMVDACVRTARDLGVRRQDCHADAFYTEADRPSTEAAS